MKFKLVMTPHISPHSMPQIPSPLFHASFTSLMFSGLLLWLLAVIVKQRGRTLQFQLASRVPSSWIPKSIIEYSVQIVRFAFTSFNPLCLDVADTYTFIPARWVVGMHMYFGDSTYWINYGTFLMGNVLHEWWPKSEETIYQPLIIEDGRNHFTSKKCM